MRRPRWAALAIAVVVAGAALAAGGGPAAGIERRDAPELLPASSTVIAGAAAGAAPAQVSPSPTPTSPGGTPAPLPGVVLTPGETTEVDPPSTGSDDDDGGDADDDGGWFSRKVGGAINSFFAVIVEKAINPVIQGLGRTILSTPDLSGQDRVREMWGMSLQIVNISFVLLVFIAGLLMLTHDTLQTRYEFKEDAPRLLFGWIAANASLSVSAMAVDLANATSRSFTEPGLDPQKSAPAVRNIVIGLLLHSKTNPFLVLMMMVLVVMVLLVVLTCIIRTTTIMLLVMVGPMCLAFYALPQTAGIARIWWRALGGALGVQIAQSFVFAYALKVFFDGDGFASFGTSLSVTGPLMDILVLLSLFWVLLKIPAWIGKSILAPANGNGGRMLKYLVATQVMGGVRASLLHKRHAASGGRPLRPPKASERVA